MSEWKRAAVPRLAGAAINPLLRTVHFDVRNDNYYKQFTDAGKPVIFALWHGRLLPLTYYHRNQQIAALISRSADGEYLARFLETWGYLPVRGSSSRGGKEGLRDLLRLLRKGHSAAITPDGPRGPLQKLKPGILVAAQLSGAPIIPMSGSSERAWWPGKWDRFMVPKPFATVRVQYAPPFTVPRDADDAHIARATQELENILNELTAQLDAN